jgi:hypothetical protein
VRANKGWVAAIASAALLASCTQPPSSGGAAQASSVGVPVPAASGTAPVTINCGDGKQALVQQRTSGGQTVSQVDCVALPLAVPSREIAVLDDGVAVPQPANVAERVVYRPAPTVRPALRQVSSSVPVARRQKRSGKSSALIIGGSTAAGAGAGAILGGKKGALIGALLGGVGGTVYDRTTRDEP